MTLRAVLRFSGIMLMAALTSGCETPLTRAQARQGVFHRLSAADQRLVLRGKVRDGLSAEAVYIAWGEPDEKRETTPGKETAETWLYHRQITVKAPLGSFDQWSVGNSVFGMTVPLAANAGFGFGGVGNEGELLYQPHLQIQDATVKEAEFRDGKLESHRAYRGEFTLPR